MPSERSLRVLQQEEAMRLLIATLIAFGLFAGPVLAEPPHKGIRNYPFRDWLAPRKAVVVCESEELLRKIVAASNPPARFQELNTERNAENQSLCFALAFTGDVLAEPVPLGKMFFPTHMAECWAVYVRIGSFRGYALYNEPVLDRDGRPVQARAS
jgi:hypothetical protein